MPDSSTQSLTMSAEPSAIMDVIADFAAYPEWTGAVKKAEVTDAGPDGRARRVKFGLDAGLIKDTYELEYTWRGDGLGVSWNLVSGVLQKSQHGSYTLRRVAAASENLTEVTYSLTVA